MKALEAFLYFREEECYVSSPFVSRKSSCARHCVYLNTRDKCISKAYDLHVCPDVDVTAGNLGRAEENVPAVASRTIDSDRVLPAVSGAAVQSDFAALAAVKRVRRPRGLIPAALEIRGHLGGGEREDRSQAQKSGLTQHCRCRCSSLFSFVYLPWCWFDWVDLTTYSQRILSPFLPFLQRHNERARTLATFLKSSNSEPEVPSYMIDIRRTFLRRGRPPV